MPFSDHLAGLDEAVAAELAEAAVLRPASGAASSAVRVIYERPQPIEGLDAGEVAVGRPTIEVSVADAPVLRRGDLVDVTGQAARVRIAGAPARPGDGRWWLAPVEELGAIP